MNAQPAILSIAVLASFALALGGGWLIAKRRDRRRGALMIAMALILLGNVLIWALPTPAHSAPRQLPADVRAFIARRDSCDHWRGEEGYDAPRAREIARAVAPDCRGTDRALSKLRRAYRGDVQVRRALAGYETRIEGPAR